MKTDPATVPPPQALLVAAWGCTCHRCGHAWVAVCRCGSRAPGRIHRQGIHKPRCKPPAACARCKSAAWAYPLDEAGPGKRVRKAGA